MKQGYKTKMGGFNQIEGKENSVEDNWTLKLVAQTVQEFSFIRGFLNPTGKNTKKSDQNSAEHDSLSRSISQRSFPVWMIGSNSNQRRFYKIRRATTLTLPQKNVANFGVYHNR